MLLDWLASTGYMGKVTWNRGGDWSGDEAYDDCWENRSWASRWDPWDERRAGGNGWTVVASLD